jgi:photosystem II stability/assembly factor-like uncharacterized protein
MTICLSHGGPTIYESDEPSNRLVVATIKGVAFLERSGPGEPWTERHRALEDFHVVGVALEPQSGAIIATMHDGGLSVSEDDGRSWEKRTTGIASNNVYCIAYSHFNGTVRLYAGTEPAHLYVSEDLGLNWRELAGLRSGPSVPGWTFPVPPHDAHVINVSFHPHDPNTILACVEQGGLLKSTDAGATWRELKGFNDDVHRVLILNGNPDRYFLPTGYGFYRSDDAGENWTDLSDRIKPIGYPDPMVINPHNEDLMFIVGGDADPFHWMETKSANPKILRTRDGGETWQVVDQGMPARFSASFEAMSIEAWPGGSSVYAANTNGDIWCSDDEGDSWQRVATDLSPVSKTIHYTILQQDLSFEKQDRPQAS